ncbi:hypothetical protein ACVWYT_006691 [Streptomyces sp. TE4109]|nr:hypothetical protein EES42_01050 [Streptomyces sp. ADI95-17]
MPRSRPCTYEGRARLFAGRGLRASCVRTVGCLLPDGTAARWQERSVGRGGVAGPWIIPGIAVQLHTFLCPTLDGSSGSSGVFAQ